jgi:NAD-specific glutamate dehydrogenase
MNVQKGREVVAQYRSLLSLLPKTSGPFDRDPTPREAASHLAGMLDQMEQFLDNVEGHANPTRSAREHADWDKFNRWLGFGQGVFWSQGTYTLDQMRDHNRT